MGGGRRGRLARNPLRTRPWAAADAWPRLFDYRPARWRFQTHPWRPWLLPAAVWLCVGVAATALVTDDAARWACAVAVPVVLLSTYGAYRLKIKPLRDAAAAELHEVLAWRKEHFP